MPPSWKKSGRIARLISGLRSNRAAASSLSVETGFPTSLADLLVKNHSRLKTKKTAAASIQASPRPPSPPPLPPARAPPPPPAQPLPPPPPARAPLPPPPPPARAPPPPPARAPLPPPPPAAAAVTRPLPAAAERAPAVRVGFRFLVAETLALVLLAVGEKQLVLRITVVAFVLMVLDLLGFRVFELFTPCAEARKGIDSDFEVAGSRSESEGSVSGELVEMREHHDGAVQKVLGKKSWKRLVPKRLRSKRSTKDVRDYMDELDSGSDGRRVSSSSCVRDYIDELDSGSDVRRVSSSSCVRDYIDELDSGSDGRRVSSSSCGSEEGEAEICVVQSFEGNACECRSVSSRRLLLFVVLLFGLAGGRVAALAVTVAWFMLTNSIDTLWRKSRVDRVC